MPKPGPDAATPLTLHGIIALMGVHPKERYVAQRQKKLRRMAIGSAVTLVLAVIIAVLTLAPMPAGGPAGSDKIYHILAFACLAFPLPLVRPRWAVWVILSVIAYGGAIEVIQPFFGRQAEWADLFADGIGAILGASVARQLGLRLRRSGGLNDKDDPMTAAWLAEDAALTGDGYTSPRSRLK
jgi:VanZ family protein